MQNKRNIILRNHQAVGDLVALTRVIEDLKNQYPEINIDVQSSCPAIFENNPNLTKLNKYVDNCEVYNIGYTEGINKSKESGEHFTSAFYLEINKLLNLNVKQTKLEPCLYLSAKEKNFNYIKNKLNLPNKYWVINAGHKSDFPAKQWGYDNWQKTVKEMYRMGVNCVQVGERSTVFDSIVHSHPNLDNVFNIVGKTNLRDFLTLIHHSQGVMCHITGAMHIAAAFNKPCVVIAGGREPRRWEMYQNHRFIDTIGLLPCCKNTGCMKTGRISLENGKINDSSCLNPGIYHTKCMEMISHHKVISEISNFYVGGILE